MMPYAPCALLLSWMEGIKSYNSEQLRILPPSATVFCAARKAVENAEEPLQWIGFRIAATRKGVNRLIQNSKRLIADSHTLRQEISKRVKSMRDSKSPDTVPTKAHKAAIVL